MSFDDGIFIETIENFPCIWDTKLREHKDKLYVENAWKNISQIIDIPANECQDMWKSLRAKYVRERKMIKDMPSGSAAYTGFWEHFNKMGFIAPHIQIRRTKGNILKKCLNADTIAGPSSACEETIIETLVVNEEGTILSSSVENSENHTYSQDELTETEETFVGLNEDSDSTNTYSSCPASSNIKIVEEKNSILRRERNQKNLKRKITETNLNPDVNILLESCANIGQNIKNYIEDNNITDHNYFAMSLGESLSKIKGEKKKLLLKAKILTMIANEIEDEVE